MSGIQQQSRLGANQAPAIGQIERPVTASSQGAKVRELQEEVKKEQREKRKLQDQIENLKQEI